MSEFENGNGESSDTVLEEEQPVIERHFSFTDVAAMTGVSWSLIRRMVLDGKIAHRRVGKKYLIPQSEIAHILGPIIPAINRTEGGLTRR